jgi:hypothetical protein
MLAYYAEWHLREAWKPFLFDFDDETPGAHEGGSPVRPSLRSPQARDKARTRQTPQGWPVHSFGRLLADLSTVARHPWRIPARPDIPPFTAVTVPTPFQGRCSVGSAGSSAPAVDRTARLESAAMPALSPFPTPRMPELRPGDPFGTPTPW